MGAVSLCRRGWTTLKGPAAPLDPAPAPGSARLSAQAPPRLTAGMNALAAAPYPSPKKSSGSRARREAAGAPGVSPI